MTESSTATKLGSERAPNDAPVQLARKTAVIIPALNPPEGLPAQIRQLQALGFAPIIVVNDGSDASFASLFEAASKLPGCDVLHHAVNLGKGRALKTGFNHLLVRYPDAYGVVTFDADGQHRPHDALLVANQLAQNPNKLVLGSRPFDRGVPWRSRAGNLITRWLFALLLGARVSDTQSGLRAISCSAIPELLRLAGERYDYEMNMLVSAQARSRPIVEQTIETIYIDGNRASHFSPVLDSMRVGFILVRFYLSSLIAAGLDLVIFTIVFGLTSNVLWSLIAARAVVGPLVNFGLNRAFVFKHRAGVVGPLAKYYLLLAFSGLVAYVAIQALSQATGWHVIVCKIAVETPLSLFNFAIQRLFVFDRVADDAT